MSWPRRCTCSFAISRLALRPWCSDPWRWKLVVERVHLRVGGSVWGRPCQGNPESPGFLGIPNTCYLVWSTVTTPKRIVEWKVLVSFSFPSLIIMHFIYMSPSSLQSSFKAACSLEAHTLWQRYSRYFHLYFKLILKRKRKSQRSIPCQLLPKIYFGMRYDLDFNFINVNCPELRRQKAQRRNSNLGLLIPSVKVSIASHPTFLQHKFFASFCLNVRDGTKRHYYKFLFPLHI